MTQFPIPVRLNLLLSALVFCTALALLWVSSHTDSTALLLALGLVYSFVLLTGYALMHEATHGLLHPERRINAALGMVLGWLFPVAFTLLTVSHDVHHRYNRSYNEMFDCYHPGDVRLVKFIQWYGILTGVWWSLIPLGSLLLATVPGVLKSPPFRRARSTAILFDDYGPRELRRLRLEVVLGILFWVLAFHLLALRWEALAVLYVCFALNWSGRQYVTHAFTIRDARDGALNLRVGRITGTLLLHGQWDRVHHQNPHVPWIHLPQLGGRYDGAYWRHYLRQWLGPRPCTEPPAQPLTAAHYKAMP